MPVEPRPWLYVLAGGLVAGTGDIVYACVFWALRTGAPALRILQSVAACLLGRASFEGGVATANLGLVLHYLTATTMSVTYYLVASPWPSFAGVPSSAAPTTVCSSSSS